MSLKELVPNGTKLADLEKRMVEDTMVRDGLVVGLRQVREEILPIRLKFNAFLNKMSHLDSEPQGAKTNEERFKEVRDNLLDLYKSIQTLSARFHEIQPLFSVIEQFGAVDGEKQFCPLETLGNGPTVSSIPTTVPTAPVGKKSAVSTPANNDKPSPSVGPTASSAAAKKPRKPRQSKKTPVHTPAGNPTPRTAAQTPLSVPSSSGPGGDVGVSSGAAAAAAASAMNSTISMPQHILSSAMSPMMGSTMGTPNNMNQMSSSQQPQAPQQQQQQVHAPFMGANPAASTNNTSAQSLTPANILSMNNGNMNATNAERPERYGSVDLSSMDLGNLDLGSLNMDFL
ncbi:Pgd1p KNAG_0C02950 [Huiozyma naganishii CBS 8797]|uniref:Mediator of RNA polymerase II transcription subunit 3 n=1 Tax=Huiozyma naganishii (strain ATCC MYA-139 / BCRC 22969 / CBS 8797 / KCTC 17520 / NBRC 10181 / NCYC 3082 / Yp74L-3) TaxID=1071383 RepID=J7S5W6_HUIN7|nr:hypothetical protein KNAG_0C02950 [Kazachstania naganishii CBS 8797]CCK69406.1 hypothetical protein KNAG_0C02950 [Kazachstania naganishii CBS 8797]